MEGIQAVFIDRDGTIGGTGRFIHPRDFTLYPFSLEAIGLMKASGMRAFALTNQHRISRGEATALEFMEQFASYGFDASYICPHEPEEGCDCHKPKPGLLLRAAEEHGLDLRRCALIGDVGSADMLAADAVGAVKILVRTGWGERSLTDFRHAWSWTEPDFVAANVLEAARWLVSRKPA